MPKIAAALLLAGLAAAAPLAPGAAWAQISAGKGGVMVSPPRASCAAELHTYCAHIPRVPGAARQCLAVHRDHLSPGCRLSLSQVGTH